jgi:hypothetical protein
MNRAGGQLKEEDEDEIAMAKPSVCTTNLTSHLKIIQKMNLSFLP